MTLPLEALKACLTLIDQMSNYVGQMALPDYKLFNEAPILASKAIKELETGTTNLELGSVNWSPIVKDRSHLMGVVYLDRVPFHAEAMEVTEVPLNEQEGLGQYQRGVGPAAEEAFNFLEDYIDGMDGPFRTITIQGRSYVLVLTPFAR